MMKLLLQKKAIHFVENKKDEKIVIDENVEMKGKTIEVRKCDNCEIQINLPKITKIIIHECTQTQISFNVNVIVGIEFISLKGCKIEIDNSDNKFQPLILTVDMCKESEFSFKPYINEEEEEKKAKYPEFQIISANDCSQNYIILGKEKYEIQHEEDSIQYKTGTKNSIKQGLMGSNIRTDSLLREGGYLTTKHEMEINEKREKLFDQKMEEMISKMVSPMIKKNNIEENCEFPHHIDEKKWDMIKTTLKQEEIKDYKQLIKVIQKFYGTEIKELDCNNLIEVLKVNNEENSNFFKYTIPFMKDLILETENLFPQKIKKLKS
jgi:hypothetical protein